MFQLIILGLLFLFIFLHFYTDISIYMNTGNTIEGNQNVGDGAGGAANSATDTTTSTDTAADATTPPVSRRHPDRGNTILPEGVCLGKKSQFNQSCSLLKTKIVCQSNKTDKCKWSSVDSNPYLAGESARHRARNSQKCGVSGGVCLKNCVKPNKWYGNCENTEYINSEGKREKLCGWKCYEDINDKKSCQAAKDCTGCPCEDVEWSNTTQQKTFDMTGTNWLEKAEEASAVSGSTYGSGDKESPWALTSDEGIIDDKIIKEVLSDKNLIAGDINLNDSDMRQADFIRIGESVLNKIKLKMNLETPTMDENDKELLGRSYRQTYELKKPGAENDPIAIKSMETRFKKTLYSLLSKSSLTANSFNGDTPVQTSAVDSTTGMFHDKGNTFFGQGDMAKNNSKKPDGGLCLWKGCDSTKRKPYDSIWSLY